MATDVLDRTSHTLKGHVYVDILEGLQDLKIALKSR